LLYTNLASLTAKFDLLLLELNRHNPLVVVVSETWLRREIPDTLIHIIGYNLFRCDRLDSKRGGGVAVYVAEKFNNIPVKACIKQHNNFGYTECLWVEITLANFVFTVGGVYRPPTSNINEDNALYNNIRSFTDTTKTLVILGDFNLPEIEWPLGHLHRFHSSSSLFLDMYTDTNLNQLVDQPTRHRND
jgi:exonuclease III